MLTKFIIILSILLAINFLLLVFSCNKVPKKQAPKPKVKTQDIPEIPTANPKVLETSQLAPTGS